MKMTQRNDEVPWTLGYIKIPGIRKKKTKEHCEFGGAQVQAGKPGDTD
jgi:hypothetical protein